MDKLKEQQFVDEAYRLFKQYYEALRPFREKVIENEEYWRTNHWVNENVPDTEPKPVTPILFSTVESMLADIMDNFPEPVVRAEEVNDEAIADEIGDIVKWILDKRNYKTTFRKNKRDLLIKGASVTQIFWNKDLYNGLGDIDIINWDIKNFLWDPKCGEDIQNSRAIFKFVWLPEEYFKDRYPKQYPNMKHDEYQRDDYSHIYMIQNENKETRKEILLIEYWYKKWDAEEERYTVHMAKLAGGQILEWSEPVLPKGIYENGKYPFVVHALYQLAGTPVGLGLVDIFKSMQKYVDKLDQIILKNALLSSRMKLLVSKAAGVDEDDLLDWSKEIVSGDLVNESVIRWFQPAPLPGYLFNYLNEKIALIKEESGQNQFNRGEGGKGVTAASAIRLLQEAGNKRARQVIDDIYEKFKEEVNLIIDLMLQFYTETRKFRIRGNGIEPDKIIEFNANDIKYMTTPEGKKLKKYIEFDIKVSAQKNSPYLSMYQNELAVQLRQLGVLNEIEMLELMDFEGKEKILQMVNNRLNQQMQQQMMAMLPQQAMMELPQQATLAEPTENTQQTSTNEEELVRLQEENQKLREYINQLEELLQTTSR